MTGIILRLAGPLQSWGEHAAFNERDTVAFPTRSGLIGLIAAAEGRSRGQSLDRYEQLRFTVRVDRPGRVTRDFHTIGGGYPRTSTVRTAEGKYRPAGTATIVTRRHYLADAVFCAAVTGPQQLIRQVEAALRAPRWQPYLGRRSCPPDTPLLVAIVDDPEAHLAIRVPVARRNPRDADHVALDFVEEGSHADRGTVTQLADVPESFNPLHRRYATRPVTIAARPVPAHLCAGHGLPYQKALHQYVQETR